MTTTANPVMNPVMYGFQRVTSATTITRRVLTESRPSMSTRQKVVGLSTCKGLNFGV